MMVEFFWERIREARDPPRAIVSNTPRVATQWRYHLFASDQPTEAL